jgi:Fanconi anemia group M protein
MQKGFDIEFKQLPVADYIVGDVAIERKTINDLKNSIINKRINKQLTEIKQFKKHILIIEGFDSEAYKSGIIHENALRGFLLSIAINYQVPIIYTADAKDTAQYLSILANKSPNKEAALRATKQQFSEKEKMIYILEGFPGIGPSTAKKLLEKYKKLKDVITAPENDLKNIIGEKATSIIQLRELVYDKL